MMETEMFFEPLDIVSELTRLLAREGYVTNTSSSLLQFLLFPLGAQGIRKTLRFTSVS
jgi:hypothetical protein